MQNSFIGPIMQCVKHLVDLLLVGKVSDHQTFEILLIDFSMKSDYYSYGGPSSTSVFNILS